MLLMSGVASCALCCGTLRCVCDMECQWSCHDMLLVNLQMLQLDLLLCHQIPGFVLLGNHQDQSAINTDPCIHTCQPIISALIISALIKASVLWNTGRPYYLYRKRHALVHGKLSGVPRCPPKQSKASGICNCHCFIRWFATWLGGAEPLQ